MKKKKEKNKDFRFARDTVIGGTKRGTETERRLFRRQQSLARRRDRVF